MTSVRLRLEELWQREQVRQFVRFMIAGGFTTGLYAAAYSLLAGFRITSEQIANFVGYILAMMSGYLLHSLWSFRGHGQSLGKSSWRFIVVSLTSYVSNTAWVFVLTDHRMLAGPWWWPLIPVTFVTPLVNFSLNRLWVFS